MPDELISLLMMYLGVLTIIPPDEVRSKGIPYVFSKFDLSEESEIWHRFYDYMLRIWCTSYKIEVCVFEGLV